MISFRDEVAHASACRSDIHVAARQAVSMIRPVPGSRPKPGRFQADWWFSATTSERNPVYLIEETSPIVWAANCHDLGVRCAMKRAFLALLAAAALVVPAWAQDDGD